MLRVWHACHTRSREAPNGPENQHRLRTLHAFTITQFRTAAVQLRDFFDEAEAESGALLATVGARQ